MLIIMLPNMMYRYSGLMTPSQYQQNLLILPSLMENCCCLLFLRVAGRGKNILKN